MLRKLLYTTALFIGVGSLTFAQSNMPEGRNLKNSSLNLSQFISSLDNEPPFARKGTPSNQVSSTTQLNLDISTPRGGQGAMAGVCWTGTEFWVSSWNSDSMFTYSATGALTSRFTVAGVGSTSSGSRALTWDGTYVYAGTATPSIFQIDPTTKLLVSTISAPQVVRGLTYDSLADAGAGGFWVSDYNSALTQIGMTGAVLQSISQVTHGLTSMYGIAVDNYTTGEPYLWVFDQASSLGTADLKRVTIATGATLPVRRDVFADMGSTENSGLAGGLSYAWGLAANGTRSLIGIMQSSPRNRLFSYELNDSIFAFTDAVAVKFNFTPPLTYVPLHLLTNTFWDMDAINNGINSLDTMSFIVNFDSSSVHIHSDTVRAYNVLSGTGSNFSSPVGFAPSTKGVYRVKGFMNTGSQIDEAHSNDTVSYRLVVNDSTLGLDDNTLTGRFGIGTGSGGVLGQKFIVNGSTFASSVTAYFYDPSPGDSIDISLYTFGGSPGTIIATTRTYQFTLSDSINGVQLTLPLIGAPYQLAAGVYFVGVREYNRNMSMGYTDFNFQPLSTFYQVPYGATWAILEGLDPTFQFTFILRLNVLDPLLVGIPQVYRQSIFTVYPNPTSNLLTINLKESNSSAQLSMLDISGREVYSRTGLRESNVIDINSFSEGIYFVRVVMDGEVYSERVTIAK